MTTTADSGSDFIIHFQVNDRCNDAEALMEAATGSEEKAGGRHRIIVADAGFASMDNYEKLDEAEQEALIPDKLLDVEIHNKTTKGEYDRSRFLYEKKQDRYKCPCGKLLDRKGDVKQSGRYYARYANLEACRKCPQRALCTKSSHRVILRDKNEEVRERMRKRMKKKQNKKRYKQRSHTVESPYGQIKHNLKYRIFMRRGKAKVMMEAALLFMLHNIIKIGSN
ncbi:MAG: transposase [Spirochaetales bacterium]|nr:transposase [Spirochaetales bacterium]